MNVEAERGEFASLTAPVLEPLGPVLEFFGVSIIMFRGDGGVETAYTRYRANLGRGILLGLEVLIAAAMIATITSHLTWESVSLPGRAYQNVPELLPRGGG